jgi:hypothetical protein
MQQVAGPATGLEYESGFDSSSAAVALQERWATLLAEKGMREALRIRDAEFDLDVARI